MRVVQLHRPVRAVLEDHGRRRVRPGVSLHHTRHNVVVTGSVSPSSLGRRQFAKARPVPWVRWRAGGYRRVPAPGPLRTVSCRFRPRVAAVVEDQPRRQARRGNECSMHLRRGGVLLAIGLLCFFLSREEVLLLVVCDELTCVGVVLLVRVWCLGGRASSPPPSPCAPRVAGLAVATALWRSRIGAGGTSDAPRPREGASSGAAGSIAPASAAMSRD
jgi:hypothetical protein